MNNHALTGFSAQGIVVVLMVGWCVNSEKEPTAKTYGSMIGAGAGAIASFVPFFASASSHEIWVYPIALLFGLLVAPFLDVAYVRYYASDDVAQLFDRYDKAYPKSTKSKKK
jgi:hypothetical protein